MHRICILLVGLFSLSACTTSEVLVAHSVDLVSSVEAIPEEQLLDVGIVVFDPGVPEGELPEEVVEELMTEGSFPQVRRAEALYMAVELRDTLQQSGHWGGVWVTPEESVASDLNITGEILHSDGANVTLQIRAEDAAGRVWLDEPYELETAAGVYNRGRYPDKDPYQDLFNSIANDLADGPGRIVGRGRAADPHRGRSALCGGPEPRSLRRLCRGKPQRRARTGTAACRRRSDVRSHATDPATRAAFLRYAEPALCEFLGRRVGVLR